MTLLFATLLGGFCLLALGQIILAFKSAPATPIDSTDSTISLQKWYQQQADELVHQAEHHEIKPSLYHQNLLALKRELLNAQPSKVHAKPTITLPFGLSLALGLFVVALSAGFYWQQGSAQQLIKTYQSAQKTAQAEQFLQTMGGKQAIKAKLHAQLKRHPTDAQGWYLLGRLYFNDGEYAPAIAALNHANTLKPNNSETELTLAEALTLSQQQPSRAQQLLDDLLKREPENPGALNLNALIAYQNHHYQRAIDLWQHLWEQIPPNSETAKALQSAIQKAQHDEKNKPLSPAEPRKRSITL